MPNACRSPLLVEPQQQTGRRGGAEQSGVGTRVESAASCARPVARPIRAPTSKPATHATASSSAVGTPAARAVVACCAVSGDRQCGGDDLCGAVNHRVGVQVVEFKAVHERPVGQRRLAWQGPVAPVPRTAASATPP